MLFSEFLEPMRISQRTLADAIPVPYQCVNEIINQKRGIALGTALRLAKYFGISADFWLNLQVRWNLYRSLQSEAEDIKTIQPLAS